MEQTEIDRLTEALRRAAAAHGIHEQETGHEDPDWPSWYAAHMTRELAQDGYRLIRSGSP